MASVLDVSKTYLLTGPLRFVPLTDIFMLYSTKKKLNYGVFTTSDNWMHFEMTPFTTVQEASEFLQVRYNIKLAKTYPYYESKIIDNIGKGRVLEAIINPLHNTHPLYIGIGEFMWNGSLLSAALDQFAHRYNVDTMQVANFNSSHCEVIFSPGLLDPIFLKHVCKPILQHRIMLHYGETVSASSR